ncbi:DUF2511 domain-containing protein [Streptomyces sp. CA-253872]|uniref:DUF2511 domain-containing protein n=1 Tax=Streptomyces sp. CA-253872 TaxID=3240067 RepID=UPI003D8F32CC
MTMHHHGRARTVTAALVGFLLLMLTSCGGGGSGSEPHSGSSAPVPLPSPTSTKQALNEKNLGYMWPLTVDHGTAECRKGEQAVFQAPDGTTYALNERAKEAGYADISAIRASGDGGGKVSLGVLLSRTMKLCRAG